MSKAVLIICVSLTLRAAGIGPVSPYRGLIDLYADNRKAGIGNFVTRDLILLAYSGAYADAIVETERTVAIPLTWRVVTRLSRRAATAKHPANRSFAAVLTALREGAPPKDAAAAAEYRLIQNGGGIARSDLHLQNIDYSQFRPRGWYAASEETARYFRAARYASTVLFAIRDSASTGIGSREADELTGRALELASWLRSDPNYTRLNRTLERIFGSPDDLLAADLPAPSARPIGLVRAELITAAKAKGRTPRILGGLVDAARLEKGVSAAEALTGWRLLPQRYTPDSAALQQLVFDQVTGYRGEGSPFTSGMINGHKVKVFPRALELLALAGSADAAKRLDSDGDSRYDGYAEASAKAAILLKGTGSPLLSPLRELAQDPAGSTAALALWTRYRWMNLLYAKQSYTVESKGIELAQPRAAAYLERATALYKQLAVEARRWTPPVPGLVKLLDRCAAISAAEDAGQPLNAQQIAFLNDIDLAVKPMAESSDHPLIADVHTDPASQQILEEGVGFAIPVRHEKTLRGARWTHSEFKQPMSKRLNDPEWENKIRAEAHR